MKGKAIKIDFDQQLVAVTGQKITVNGQKGSSPVTLKTACIDALIMDSDEEAKKTPVEQKRLRGRLAGRIHKAKGMTSITPEELELIKRAVGKRFRTVLVCAVFDALEKKGA
jgi:hypothetical protein